MTHDPRLTRRKTLCAAAGVFAAAAAGRAAFAGLPRRHDLHLATRGGVAFGTTVFLTIAGPDPKALETALDAGFAATRDVENASSVYRPDSDIARLNRTGRLDAPSIHLVTQLRYAEALSRETDGSFDATVQPLWDIWAAFHARGTRPTPADLAHVLARVDWRGVRVADDRITLDRPGMALTLNSINQGYAADVTMAAIAARGIEHAIVDTGEFCAKGHHPEGRGWRLGVVDPRDNERIAFTLDPFRRAAATSGDYKTFFSPDFRDHHIFDPRTGYSRPDWSQITVEAPSAMIANGLSTALFAMNVDAGRRLMAAHPDCTARVFAKDGRDLGTLAPGA